jgi:preprotein translocase subunit SecD
MATDPEAEQARQAIEDRLAAYGIDGTVTTDGNTIVATLKNDDGSDADAFARMPKMYIRPVLQSGPADQLPDLTSQPPLTPPAPTGNAIQDARATRQSTDPQIQMLAVANLDCKQPDPLHGNDDPSLPLVTCSADGTQKFILDKSRLDGTEIQTATSEPNQHDQPAVSISFTPGGADKWATLTSESVQKQLAFTIDTTVISAPVVQQGPQLGGTTQITGRFTTDQAKTLARTISQAAVPLAIRATAKQVLRPTK